MPSTHHKSHHPNMIVGKRRDEQFTVQAPLQKLRESIPPSYFTPQLALITDGKAVGEAIRVVGPDLVYVRFPENASGYPVSFTVPRCFLIPVTCRILARQNSRTDMMARRASSDFGAVGGSLPSAGHVSMVSPSPIPTATGSPTYPAGVPLHHSKDHHGHVDLHQCLGDKGEPALCVVCGTWDESEGQKRKSGHKCQQCIGKKSLDRLRQEFQRLLESELNESDDEELARE